jgi:hypothetical protein
MSAVSVGVACRGGGTWARNFSRDRKTQEKADEAAVTRCKDVIMTAPEALSSAEAKAAFTLAAGTTA